MLTQQSWIQKCKQIRLANGRQEATKIMKNVLHQKNCLITADNCRWTEKKSIHVDYYNLLYTV